MDAQQAQPVTVAILDDDYPLHDYVRFQLQGRTDIVLTAEGWAGEDLAGMLEARPNVLLLDVMIPSKRGGYAVEDPFPTLEELRRLSQALKEIQTRVLLLSTEFHYDVLDLGFASDTVCGYLLKSDQRTRDLPARIHEAMSGQLVFSNKVSESLGSGPRRAMLDLSPAELDLMLALSKDVRATPRDLAGKLFKSEQTVKNQLSAVMKKLDAPTRGAALVILMQQGIIRLRGTGPLSAPGHV